MPKERIRKYDPLNREFVDFYDDPLVEEIIEAGSSTSIPFPEKDYEVSDGPAASFFDEETQSEQWGYHTHFEPRRNALKKELARAALNWATNRALRSDKPTNHQVIEALKDVETASHRVFMSLGIRPDGSVDDIPHALKGGALFAAAATEINDPHIDTGGVVNDALFGVRSLFRWSQQAQKMRKRRKAKSPKGNSGDKALDVWIYELQGIWLDFFQQLKPSIRKDATGSHSTGPTLRFIQTAMRPYQKGDGMTEDAIAKRLSRIQLPIKF
ncbi:MAG: hypothetical protein AAGD43_03200 [Pseudomonadota bacterium]